MNQKDKSNVMDAIAADSIPDDVSLLSQIATQYKKNKNSPFLRTTSIKSAVLVLLSLALVTGGGYAIGHSLGYFPGVGIVEESNGIYMLAEPVTVEQAGITVTVKQMVTDSTRTFVAYQVKGIPPVTEGTPICTDPPGLQLPDGSMLNFTTGGGGGMTWINDGPISFATNYLFPPLPLQTNKVVFVSPCNMPVVELGLVPAPDDFSTPVMEIGLSFEASGPIYENASVQPDELQSTNTNVERYSFSFPPMSINDAKISGLYMEQVIESEESYILIGNFTDTGDLPGALAISGASDYEYQLRIEDASGNIIPSKFHKDIQPVTNQAGFYHWAYEIPKPVNGPIELTLDQVNVHQEESIQFQIDAGLASQPGQIWELNLPVIFGRNEYTIDQVEMIKNGYEVKWHSGNILPNGTSFGLSIQGLSPSKEGRTLGIEDHKKNRVDYTQNYLTDETLPTGLLTFELTRYQIVPLQGPWILLWTPPDAE